MTLEPQTMEHIHRSTFVEDAINLGSACNNLLLLNYCEQLLLQYDMQVPVALQTRQHELQDMVSSGQLVRWLDTALTETDDEMPEGSLLEGKIKRTMTQLYDLQSGSQFMCFVVVPALNEENAIGGLIDSFRSQSFENPIAIIVADNNSTDETAHTASAQGANVIGAEKPGVGAARQGAIDFAILHSPVSLDRTLLLQTDADCIADKQYVRSVVSAFASNADMQIGVGPSVYHLTYEDGSTITLDSGKAYGNFLGTKGVRAYFEALGRDPADYLLEPPYRYLIGPNTTFRASALVNACVRYPEDGRWETLDLSIKLQTHFRSSQAIHFIDGQRMYVSSRAITGGSPFLSEQRLASIKHVGFVGMYRPQGVNISPDDTARQVLHELDIATYDLQQGEHVTAIVDERDAPTGDYKIVPAVHAATRTRILGKVAVIAEIKEE